METASRPLLRRIVALDRMIRGKEYPNSRTASLQLEVSSRTVHRDLDFLRDFLGAPIAFSRSHNGFYYEKPDYALPFLRLTEGELVALFLAERVLQEYRGTPYAADLATAFRKLTAALPDSVTIDLAHLSEVFSFRHRGTATAGVASFRRLTRAVREARQLELTYWTPSRDETIRRVVDPYHLASVEGEWYLVAYCHLREDVRMFVPARIRSFKETGHRFERPPDFRITDYLDASFSVIRGENHYTVRLRFAPEIARYVRQKTWHPSRASRRSPAAP